MRNLPRFLVGALLAPALAVELASAVSAAMPQDGAATPAVPVLQSVVDGGYQPFDLAVASRGTTVVLYFFPKAFTEG